MKVSLSLEKTCSNDVSIVVDTLRASTTITMALNNFKKVIPAFSPEQAKEIAKKENGILAGERKGSKLQGFDIGNSPEDVEEYNTDKNTLIITTSNGTRIIEGMNSQVLIGSLVNGKSVAKAAMKLATDHIDIVMAGYKGEFALEDYLGAGEILYWIKKELDNEEKTNSPTNNEKDKNIENKNKKEIKQSPEKWNCNENISEYAIGAILASRDLEMIKKAVKDTRSGKRLDYLGSKKDIDFCLQKNITENVGIYKNKCIKNYKF